MKRIAIVGCGRAGLSLGVALRGAGWQITGCWSRSKERAAAAASLLSTPACYGDDFGPVAAAPSILVAVVDDSIAEVAASLAPLVDDDQVMVHTSGTVSSSVLVDAGVRGPCGSFHPLASLPDVTLVGAEVAIARLRGAWFALEGAPRARALGSRLTDAVEGHALQVDSDGKALYHAGAALLANNMVTLFDASLRLLEAAGVRGGDAQKMLLSLAEGVLANLALDTPAKALTGPVQRGDVATVSAHLHAISAAGLDDVLAVYRSLVAPTAELARRAGLDHASVQRLISLAEDGE